MPHSAQSRLERGAAGAEKRKTPRAGWLREAPLPGSPVGFKLSPQPLREGVDSEQSKRREASAPPAPCTAGRPRATAPARCAPSNESSSGSSAPMRWYRGRGGADGTAAGTGPAAEGERRREMAAGAARAGGGETPGGDSAPHRPGGLNRGTGESSEGDLGGPQGVLEGVGTPRDPLEERWGDPEWLRFVLASVGNGSGRVLGCPGDLRKKNWGALEGFWGSWEGFRVSWRCL